MELERKYFDTVLEQLSHNIPESLRVYQFLKFVLENRFPSSYPVWIFVDRFPFPSFYAVGFPEGVLTATDSPSSDSCIAINIHSTSLNIAEFHDFFIKIYEKVGSKFNSFYLRIPIQFGRVCDDFFISKQMIAVYEPEVTSQYWIPPQKLQSLVDQFDRATVPSEFIVDELRIEDACFVNDSWPSKYPGSDQLWIDRIKLFPSVCIRDRNTRKLASFALTTQFGTISHLYTVLDYRRRGLGSIVARLLCKKYTDWGMIPYQFVADHSKEALNLIHKEGLFENSGVKTHHCLFRKN